MSEPTLPESVNLMDFLLKKGHGVKGLSELNLGKIPAQFIQPPEERPDQIEVAVEESIPIIDVSKWDDAEVAQSICEAAAKWGFFQIINHGIPFEVVENVKAAAHDFFELPVEERRKYLKENSPTPTVVLKTSFSPSVEKFMDWKDHLVHFVGQQEQDEDSKLWPPVSRDQVLEYIRWARPIIRKLLEVLLKGINVKHIDEVKESTLMGLLTVSLVHYPPCPNPDLAVGSGRHSDASSITLLLQDDVGGLYVRHTESDRWIHATPLQGSLIVNIGDVLQIMSNDRYKSIEHRVLVSSKNRVSIPIFANALSESVIGPLPEVLEAGEKSIYRQVLFSEYFNHFLSKGQDGKGTINYAKI